MEIAAHTDASHKGILANPQGNLEPAATTRRFDPATNRYETEAQFRERMRADVVAISDKIRAVTGKAPRVWVWPYGAADGTSLAVVSEHGYEMALTLDDGLDDSKKLMSSPRFGGLRSGRRALRQQHGLGAGQGPTARAACGLGPCLRPRPGATGA